jgi:hypothetical protein
MNVVALPVDSGYATLGHLIERGLAVEAIRADGTSLGLFSTAVAAAAALVEGRKQTVYKNRKFDGSGGAARMR